MRRPKPGKRRVADPSRLIIVGAVVVALVSTAWGLRVGLPRLDDARKYWSALPSSVRDDPVAELYGFGDELWGNLRRSIRKGDRYAVVADGDGQHEIRNYAAYTLLPAIQVRDPADADVVIYYQVDSPEFGCTTVGKNVCILRREP